MKIIHLSDLHLGKRVNEYSMLEEQQHILGQIIDITSHEKPNAVIIAGDVYDKAVPPAEAVGIFDDFLVRLSQLGVAVFVISGNHDSPERIAFGGRLMQYSGIYMSPVYDGKVSCVTLRDEYGNVNFYMLPFVKPSNVRRFHEDRDIVTYTDAIRIAMENITLNPDERNIMITHQFVTGAERTESEEISVGGIDNVDISVFDDFDYTALGHIHRPQNCKSEKVRYCGTPLKYSFSEVNDKKSVTIAEIKEKGNLSIRTRELLPLHDMKEIKGKYNDLMLRDFYMDTTYGEDYMHITLTDEEDIPDAVGKLRTVYHNLMKLDYDNIRTRSTAFVDNVSAIEKKSPFAHFADFFEIQNNQPMTDEQKEFVIQLISDVWEDGK